MFIWLLFALLVGGFALIGHQTGAIRSGVAFFGVILGLVLNAALTPMARAAFAGMGVKDDLALMLIPSFTVFVIFWLVFMLIGVAVHRPIELNIKYKSDEPNRAGFERANKGCGLFVGILSGICVFLSVGSFIYRYGYVTAQIAPAEGSEPAQVQLVSDIRKDMAASGWDKTFAALDKTTPQFYQIADILGTLYNNPLAHGRAAEYPPFLHLSERSEFTDLGADADYMGLLQKKAGFAAIWNHPKTQAIIKNGEIMSILMAVDLKDFRTYLETGNSPKYQDDKLLGRWKLDVGAVINHLRRQKQNLSALEIRRMRAALVPMLSGVAFAAYTDNRFKLEVTAPAATPPPADGATTEAAAQPPTTITDPNLAARYGVRRTGAAPAAARPTAPVVAAKPIKIEGFQAVEGAWTRGNGNYLLKPDGSGPEAEATVNDETGRLSWVVGTGDLKVTLFFVRAS
ncbi:MAG TPA: CvpA family protein [Candidatus Limnocylindria bacterium]|jgi:hypothetical protein|nr:CvpA family protein [Candidatus Limnocylindria bacterium]